MLEMRAAMAGLWMGAPTRMMRDGSGSREKGSKPRGSAGSWAGVNEIDGGGLLVGSWEIDVRSRERRVRRERTAVATRDRAKFKVVLTRNAIRAK